MSATEPRIAFEGTRVGRARGRGALQALPSVTPALALLGAAVIWPLVELVRVSSGHYGQLWHEHALAAVALRSGLWAGGVVVVTLVVSLALAQLFHARFPLRRPARTALIVPWAASVTVTAVVFRWALNPRGGAINVVLHALGLVRLDSTDAAWLARPDWGLVWMMAVAVFISVPVTTYILLAALGTIPEAVREGARIDAPVPWRRFRTVTLPLIAPALAAGALIDLVTVFNALPIVWEMTRGGPGYRTSISSSFAFSLRSTSVGQSAVLSLADLVLVVAAVLAFMRVTRPRGGGSLAVGDPRRGGASPTLRIEGPVRHESLERHARRPRPLQAGAAGVAACLVALILLLPYLEMIVGSLRPTSQMLAPNLIPTHFSFANFTAVWDQGINHSLLTSLLIAGGATVLAMVTAIPAAIHSSKRADGRRSPVVVLAIATQLLGPVVLLDGFARANGGLGLPTSLALIILDAAFNLGLAIWILQARFRSLPAGLAEAAALDTMPPAARLVRTRLRPAAGSLLTALILTFVSAWNELAAALTLTGAEKIGRRPLTVAINNQLNQTPVQWGHVLAACVIAALPAIVLAVLIEGRLAPPMATEPRPG